MTKPPLISFDYQGALLPQHGISQTDLDQLAPQLDSVRSQMFQDLKHFHDGALVEEERRPLDAGFMDLPDRLLAEYDERREASELGRILATAKRIRESVDRVVVLGIGGSYMGARALMDSCCEPYFNELSRADRGGRPRIWFEGNNVDNDSMQGLLHLLRNTDADDPCNGRWAIVVISKSGGTLETASAFRIFLREMESRLGKSVLPDLVVPVTGAEGKLAQMADEIGCRDRFLVPDGVGGRFSVLSPVGLLPASIMGLDIMALLQGGWLMNGHFESAPVSSNIALNYVGVNHLLESNRDISVRVLSLWSKALETTGLWYDQLFAESIGKQERGATPVSVVNTRDLHSRAQQHQEGARDKVMNNVKVLSPRCDPLLIGTREHDLDELNELSGRSIPDLMEAAFQGTNAAYRESGRPTTTLTLPGINEHTMGQLLQMLMLATVAEGRLLQLNPYGQPGVEHYKRNMNRILGRV